jgi:hypothetical protein
VSLFIAALALALSPTPAESPKTTTLSLVDATHAAMEHNPELAEASSALRAAEASVRSAGALPEPMLSYQAWQQPLSRPFDPTATNMHMFGIRQSLPFPGQRGIAEGAARSESLARNDDVRYPLHRPRLAAMTRAPQTGAHGGSRDVGEAGCGVEGERPDLGGVLRGKGLHAGWPAVHGAPARWWATAGPPVGSDRARGSAVEGQAVIAG